MLVTTRNPALAFQPAETGIEILPIDNDVGSKLVLHLLSMDIVHELSSGETESAQELSEKLSGHALEISQKTGLINQRSWSIQEFMRIYDKNTMKLHGNAHIATVWKLSFESLCASSAAFLGVLSYLMPDSISQELFQSADPKLLLPTSLQFCADDLE